MGKIIDNLRRNLIIIFLSCFSFSAFAAPEQQRDSLVKLLNAEYVKQTDSHGYRYRIVKGPATFLHNNAYLLCDSSAWDLQRDVINAYGNVRIIQNGTILKSEHLTYIVQQNLAQFEGELVELSDREGNTLRTDNLDYFTKDSVAVFRRGGAIRDTSGTVIEGDTGTYDSKKGIFTFQGNVEMFTDSLFIKTTTLTYDTAIEKAYFGRQTYMWQGDGFLYADYGWYDRVQDIVYFNDNVYMNTADYEIWCGDIMYQRASSNVEMNSNVQIFNEERSTVIASGKTVASTDSISDVHAQFTKNPVIIYYGENENHVADSLFVAGDTLNLFTRRVCDISAKEFEDAQKEKEDIFFDAIAQAEKQAAEEYAKNKAEAEAKRPENIARARRMKLAAKATADSLYRLGMAVPDSLIQTGELNPDDYRLALDTATDSTDTVITENVPANKTVSTVKNRQENLLANISENTADSFKPVSDSTTVSSPTDSTALEPSHHQHVNDTTQLRYIQMYRNVRMYRSDMQVKCDSVSFSEVDSIARLFHSPVLWNEGTNQLTSNTMRLFIKNGGFERGSLEDNAMIITQEDTVHFDQIKGTTMLGYFRDNQLYRFDALGGVNAMFYMREQEQITTLNIKEARSLMVTMKDGTAERMKYYEQVKSNAHPIIGMPIEDQRLKGFTWRDDERPKDRFHITNITVNTSERSKYDYAPLPLFSTVDKYFDTDMASVSRELSDRRHTTIATRNQRISQNQLQDINKTTNDSEDIIRTEQEKEPVTGPFTDTLIKNAVIQAPDTTMQDAFKDTLIKNPDIQAIDTVVHRAFKDTLIPAPLLLTPPEVTTPVAETPANETTEPVKENSSFEINIELTDSKGDLIANVIVSKDGVTEVFIKEKLNLFQRWKLKHKIRKAKRDLRRASSAL